MEQVFTIKNKFIIHCIWVSISDAKIHFFYYMYHFFIYFIYYSPITKVLYIQLILRFTSLRSESVFKDLFLSDDSDPPQIH